MRYLFQRTPPEFDHWANIYYERMGKPVTTHDSFWNVCCDHFRQGPDVEADLHIPLSSYLETTHRIEEEEIPFVADQQPLRRVAEMHGEGFTKSNRGRPADAVVSLSMVAGPSTSTGANNMYGAPEYACFTSSEEDSDGDI
jgi:hypothetical protein